MSEWKIYIVRWIIEGGGRYVPPAEGFGGDYNEDLTGTEIITAPNAEIAKSVVEQAQPRAKVKKPVLLKS